MIENPASPDTNSDKKVRPVNRYGIGIELLKGQRDRITNAGKYSERYKDVFSHKVPNEDKFPLTSRCRDTMELYRKVSKGEKADGSPGVSLKHLTTEKMKLVTSKSNATNDLNKQENALIGFKFVPEGTHKAALTNSPVSTPRTPKWCKKLRDVNIYNVTPIDSLPCTSPTSLTVGVPPGFSPKSPVDSSPNSSSGISSFSPKSQMDSTSTSSSSSNCAAPKPQLVSLNLILNGTTNDNTMAHLQNVEDIISKLNEKEKKEENLRKFEEMVKKYSSKSAPTKPAIPVIKEPIKKRSQENITKQTKESSLIDKSTDVLKPQEHILDPIKHCSEVEDLQSKGLSDTEGEGGHEPFKRHVKERKSMDHHAIKENRTNNTNHLSRTASDAQDKTLKRQPRVYKERNRKVSHNLYIYQVIYFQNWHRFKETKSSFSR